MATPVTLFEFGPSPELVADLAAGQANESGLALLDSVLEAGGIRDEELGAALEAKHRREIARLLQNPRRRRLLAQLQGRAGLLRLGSSRFSETSSLVARMGDIVPLLIAQSRSAQVYAGLESGPAPSGMGSQCIPTGYLHASGAGDRGTLRDGHGLLSADGSISHIQREISSLKEAQGEWATLGNRVEDLFGRASLSDRRITEILRSLYVILKSRSQGLSPQQIGELLDVFEKILDEGGSFREISKLRKKMEAEAARSARPPRQPPSPQRRGLLFIEVSDSSEEVAAAMRVYNQIVGEFRKGRYSGIRELPPIVQRLIEFYDVIEGRHNISETLRALRATAYRTSGHLRRAYAVDRASVLNIETMIDQRFETSLRPSTPTRRPHLDELDRDMDLRDYGLKKGVDQGADLRRKADRYMSGAKKNSKE